MHPRPSAWRRQRQQPPRFPPRTAARAHRELALDVLQQHLGQRPLDELDRHHLPGPQVLEGPGVTGASPACTGSGRPHSSRAQGTRGAAPCLGRAPSAAWPSHAPALTRPRHPSARCPATHPGASRACSLARCRTRFSSWPPRPASGPWRGRWLSLSPRCAQRHPSLACSPRTPSSPRCPQQAQKGSLHRKPSEALGVVDRKP